MFNKKFNNRQPDIWCKNNNIIKVHEGNHEKDDEKEGEDKIFWCNPNNPEFDLFKFLGEIIFHILKLCEENAVNGVVNKITEDFEKIVVVMKSKELKRYVKTFYQITKNRKIRKTNNEKCNKQLSY